MPARSNITKLINCEAIIKQPLVLNACKSADVSIDVLRLDLIHPVISGNKYFKLKIALENAIAASMHGVVSFGGAWSNHLVALAYLSDAMGLPFIGVIRGERPATLSATLTDAIAYGMIPIFVSRALYGDKNQLYSFAEKEYPGFKLIPEGGQSPEGVEGAAAILTVANSSNYESGMKLYEPGSSNYDVIACAVGTGTMMAGLLRGSSINQTVLGISVLKVDAGNSMEDFIRLHSPGKPYSIFYDYHFGGYAKKSNQLFAFMNQIWQEHQLPTDFVYTGKLLFGINDLVEKKQFKPGTKMLVIHSGGLQGNRSIAGKLIFSG